MITSSCRHKNSVFLSTSPLPTSSSSSAIDIVVCATLALKRSLSVDPRKPFVAAASHRNISRFSDHFRRIRDNSLFRARSSPHRYRRSTSFADRYLSNKTWTGTLGDEPRPVEPTPTRRPVQHRSAEIGSHSSDSLSSFSTSETSFAEKSDFCCSRFELFGQKRSKSFFHQCFKRVKCFETKAWSFVVVFSLENPAVWQQQVLMKSTIYLSPLNQT